MHVSARWLCAGLRRFSLDRLARISISNSVGTTFPHLGGTRFWFECPQCRGRARIVYTPRRWRNPQPCDQCSRLVYRERPPRKNVRHFACSYECRQAQRNANYRRPRIERECGSCSKMFKQAQRRQVLLRGLQAAAVAASRAIIPGSGNPPTLLAHQAAKCVASDTSRQANRASTHGSRWTLFDIQPPKSHRRDSAMVSTMAMPIASTT